MPGTHGFVKGGNIPLHLINFCRVKYLDDDLVEKMEETIDVDESGDVDGDTNGEILATCKWFRKKRHGWRPKWEHIIVRYLLDRVVLSVQRGRRRYRNSAR